MNRRRPQAKKHKTWEGDGVLVFIEGMLTLYDTDSKLCVFSPLLCNDALMLSLSLGTAKPTLQRPLESGDELTVGGKDVSYILLH